MFSIIRTIIGCVFLVCSVVIIKKSKAIRKRVLYAIFIGISVVLTVAMAFLPFENLLITFDSPKKAYEYYNFGKSDIELVIEGDNSDFIVGSKGDSYVYLIIPKTADGWKIGLGSNTKRIDQHISDGIVIDVYQYKTTSDYFITILDTNGGKLTVSDEYNTKFLTLERSNASLGKTFVTYFAHISNYDSQYSLTVNGQEIVIGNTVEEQ